MNSFKELQEKRPELAKMLNEMSKEELLNHYALEVFEKDELAEFKHYYEETSKNLESIVSFGVNWLKSNKKGDNYQIRITKEKAELIYTNIETEFI